MSHLSNHLAGVVSRASRPWLRSKSVAIATSGCAGTGETPVTRHLLGGFGGAVGRFVIALLATTFFLSCTTFAASPDLAPLRPLPVLDGGRIKPIDTAARESIRLITGKESFRGWDALGLCLALEREPLAWETQDLLHVPYLELRQILGLAGESQHATPAAVRGSAKLRELVEAGLAKQQAAAPTGEEPRLSRLEEKALELSDRMAVFQTVAEGRRFAVIGPPSSFPPASLDSPWTTIKDTTRGGTPRVATAWQAILSGTAANSSMTDLSPAVAELANSIGAISQKNTAKGITDGIASYADANILQREVAYHRLHPFRWAWMIYLASLATLCISLLVPNRWIYRVGVALLTLGILWSAFAFAWRCSITGWAPVTNIYETVIWVALVGSIVAVALEYFGRSTIPAIAGAVAATVSGVVADVMPPEYGGSIRNLTPVLRSNLWLTVHVLTIVSSYAGFLVALVLGNIVLGQFAWRPANRAAIALNLKHLYRAVQVGTLLVAAGTILGGVWADYSWGRFWGWDPKEVWALIIFLVYLALLHGRFAGWVGPWGLAAGAVVCFLAVLMSWYGVNFILGAGLHSYGFGTGGQLYVAVFALVQLAYVGITAWLHRRHVRHTADDRASDLEAAANLPTTDRIPASDELPA